MVESVFLGKRVLFVFRYFLRFAVWVESLKERICNDISVKVTKEKENVGKVDKVRFKFKICIMLIKAAFIWPKINSNVMTYYYNLK